MPVTDTVISTSTSVGSRPVGQRFLDSLLAKVCCAGQEGIVGLPEVGDPSVVLERQHEMPAANATCGVETLEHRALLAGESEPVGHCGGDLCCS